jgi:hypothetical protein
MNAGALVVDRDEQIKWWDVLNKLVGDEFRYAPPEDALRALEMARECQHPDALWLVALFPSHGEVTTQHMGEVMLAQGDDPRALFWSWKLKKDKSLLVRSAEMGYAPAQAQVTLRTSGEERLAWAKRAVSQGDRSGLCALGSCLRRGVACPFDPEGALELYRQAAELGDGSAEWIVGEMTFGELDSQRFVWWSRAADHGCNASEFVNAALALLRSFERRQNGRILHTAAPVLRRNVNVDTRMFFGYSVFPAMAEQMRRLLHLHQEGLGRARDAVRCWSIVGRRLGVGKDVRVIIGQLAWADAWRWSEKTKRESGSSDSSGKCAIQ